MDQKLSITPELAMTIDYDCCCDITEHMLNKMRSLHYLLDQNLIECDVKWTLFVTTAQSPCYKALLKPFPPGYGTQETGYNINALLAVIDDTPPLSVVLHRIFHEIFDDLSKDVVDLLHWVLVLAEYPIFVVIDADDLGKIKLDSNVPPPTHAFKIDSGGYNCPMSTDRHIGHAYFTGKLDHIFSILSQGFKEHQQSLSKLMDAPILLKTSLKATYHRSPLCTAWGKSCCGSLISCVAIAEYVHDPEFIELRENEDGLNCLNISVQDGDFVRLRYLLLYGCRCPRIRDEIPSTIDEAISPVVGWIKRHKMQLSLAGACIMGSIAIANVRGSGLDLVKQLINPKTFTLFNRLV